MAMEQLEAALELIRQHPTGTQFVGRRPRELVEAAEHVLGVTFPPTYRRFLEELGAGGVGSAEFFGVISDNFENSAVPDGIWLTLDERLNSQLPRNLIIVAETGDGIWLALDSSRKSASGEYPVVSWSAPGPAGPPTEVVANDFGEFFLDKVEAAMERPVQRRPKGISSDG